MKIKILLFLLLVVCSSCSVSDDGGGDQGIGPWNLINIKGGVDDSETDIDRGAITWVFDEINLKLFVTNNVNGVPTGVEDGEHDYRLEQSGNETFLIIDDEEYGALSIGTRSLTIDQTITSAGTSDDEYVLLFVR